MKRFLLGLIFLLLAAVATELRAQKTYDTPRNGEGIAAFLIRNGRKGQAYRDAFMELNKKKLKGKKYLVKGMRYELPPLNKTQAKKKNKKTEQYEPLFGPKEERVSAKSSRLSGACFYIVSGHGGPDPGAIGRAGKNELHEDEYAYDIALRLAKRLMEEGATVRIIIQDAKDGIRNERYLDNSDRETCMGSPIPLNQVARLKQRCDKINALYAKDRKTHSYCRSIFLHIDSRSKKEKIDVFFYHAPDSKQGKRLAQTMKKTFEAKYDKHQPTRGFEGTVSERNLYVLRNSAPVAVFFELGNIQNQLDQRRFILDGNRQALAKWIADGLAADYNR